MLVAAAAGAGGLCGGVDGGEAGGGHPIRDR